MHTKLCKIIKQLALILSAAILLCTQIYATSHTFDDASRYYIRRIFNQDFVYGQYKDGSSFMSQNIATSSFADYGYTEFYPEVNYHQLIYAQAAAATKTVKYLYVPICSASANAYNYMMVIGSPSSNYAIQLDIIAVDTIYNGVATPANYNQYKSNGALRSENWARSQGSLTVYPIQFNVQPVAQNADVIRITLSDQTVTGSLIFGMYDIQVTSSASSIPQLITELNNIETSLTSIVTEIQTSNNAVISAINDNTTSTQSVISSLIETTIKYGDDANYYLDAITYSTDGQKLQVQSLQQHFASALQAIQAQNQIIHNNVINNAPTENQVNQVISKDQIAPDVDVSIIGGGSSNNGIGIIMSQTRVIAMITCCVGIAILSYLLFGRKT